ncbi:MFS transporter [Streptomyces cellulosae]|nr:MFS transporter [Streptomyces sp. McG7]MYQ34911.1 MFS transporter [Streptomyces sp. SID4956]WSB58570.1 MFS transporter [Streptomyces cellulosae]WTB73632.1 MFS transporter [Streptomyces cellulosae]
MPPRAPARRRASHATGFWFVAVAFTALMAFGTAPTPLWPLYEARDHFGATTVTVAYASMVVGAAGAFLGLGHLSDRLGRRRIVVPALLVGIVASLVLIVWRDLPGLIAGRVLNGVGLGLMASTATTYLHDLHHEARPERTGSVVPGIVATAANLGGLASGPLIAGAVAEWLPAPLITAQVIFTLAMAVCLALVLCTPETVHPELSAARAPSRFVLRPGGRRAFGAAGALGAFAFAILGLISSLGASVLHGSLHTDSHLVVGLAAFLMFGSAAAAQLVLGRLPLSRLLTVGAVVFPAGLLLCAVALHHPVLWLYLVAVSLSGAGSGLLFKGGVERAGSVAEPASRAGVLAVFFVVAYLGMGLPAVLFSMALRYVAVQTAMIGFATVLSCGAVVSVIVALRDRAPGPGELPAQ